MSSEQSHQLGGLPLGESRYSINSFEECIGYFSVRIKENEGEISIVGNGVLRATVLSQPHNIQLALHAEFNALHQLGASLLRVSSDQSEITARTVNIAPISVAIHSNVQGVGSDYSFQLPGPLLISRDGENLFRFQGVTRIEDLPVISAISAQPLAKPISIVNDSTQKLRTGCEQGSSAIQIDPLITAIRKAYGQVTNGDS